MNAFKIVNGAMTMALALWCWSGKASGNGGPQVGDAAPLFQALSLLGAPKGTTLDLNSLRGKVVVLEFWATWCGPCVAAIPDLNELAGQFKDQPVQIIAITAEPEATIKPFLAKRPIHGWVALDTNKAMSQAYGVVAIPHTILLGTNGRIAAITYPSAVTAQVIQDLLRGRPISLAVNRASDNVADSPGGDLGRKARALLELLVRPSLSTNMSGGGGGGQYYASGCTVRDLLPRAFDQPNSVRLVINAPLPEGRYDFTVEQALTPGRTHQDLEKNVSVLLQQTLSSTFGLRGRRETREMPVWLLKVKHPRAAGLVVSPTPGVASHLGPGIIAGTGLSVSTVAMGVEQALNQPVFDETGLTNGYDIALKWDQKTEDRPNADNLRKALEERLGLELVPAERAVGVVVIEQAQKSVE